MKSVVIVLVAARIAHAFGLARIAGVSIGRSIGTVGTFGVIVVLAVVDLATHLR